MTISIHRLVQEVIQLKQLLKNTTLLDDIQSAIIEEYPNWTESRKYKKESKLNTALRNRSRHQNMSLREKKSCLFGGNETLRNSC